MTRPYSVAFKQKMIERLTGKDAVSANRLAKETGIRQQNLSRWLQEARNLPLMEFNKQAVCTWTVEQKARLLADASKLTGEALSAISGITIPDTLAAARLGNTTNTRIFRTSVGALRRYYSVSYRGVNVTA
jgi:transposase-like protein